MGVELGFDQDEALDPLKEPGLIYSCRVCGKGFTLPPFLTSVVMPSTDPSTLKLPEEAGEKACKIFAEITRDYPRCSPRWVPGAARSILEAFCLELLPKPHSNRTKHNYIDELCAELVLHPDMKQTMYFVQQNGNNAIHSKQFNEGQVNYEELADVGALLYMVHAIVTNVLSCVRN